MNKKVLCIRLNKTRTSSLHEAFQILGLKSVHFKDDDGNNIKNIIQHKYLLGEAILKGLKQYDTISDWDRPTYTIAIFKALDLQYPESKFILNT